MSMQRFVTNVRFATALAFAGILFAAGIVTGATGGTFILGVANSATSQTALTASTSGNGAFVQNVGTGNGGLFVSNAATGIAGVTRQASRFALAGTNDGATFHPAGGAVSASGKQNHGVNASTQNVAADAIRGVNGATSGTPTETTFANGVYGESRHTLGNGVLGLANVDVGEAWGVWGQSLSAEGVGVTGGNDAGGLAGLFFGDVEVVGSVFADDFITPVTSALGVADGPAISAGDPVSLVGVREADGRLMLVVRRAVEGDRVIGVADGSVRFVPSERRPGTSIIRRGDATADAGEALVIVTSGVVKMPALSGATTGDVLAVGAGGRVGRAAPGTAADAAVIGVVAGASADGGVLVFLDPS